ncbi:MAG: hypothetical protein SGPRY_002459 [Prymnesium sp.]
MSPRDILHSISPSAQNSINSAVTRERCHCQPQLDKLRQDQSHLLSRLHYVEATLDRLLEASPFFTDTHVQHHKTSALHAVGERELRQRGRTSSPRARGALRMGLSMRCESSCCDQKESGFSCCDCEAPSPRPLDQPSGSEINCWPGSPSKSKTSPWLLSLERPKVRETSFSTLSLEQPEGREKTSLILPLEQAVRSEMSPSPLPCENLVNNEMNFVSLPLVQPARREMSPSPISLEEPVKNGINPSTVALEQPVKIKINSSPVSFEEQSGIEKEPASMSLEVQARIEKEPSSISPEERARAQKDPTSNSLEEHAWIEKEPPFISLEEQARIEKESSPVSLEERARIEVSLSHLSVEQLSEYEMRRSSISLEQASLLLPLDTPASRDMKRLSLSLEQSLGRKIIRSPSCVELPARKERFSAPSLKLLARTEGCCSSPSLKQPGEGSSPLSRKQQAKSGWKTLTSGSDGGVALVSTPAAKVRAGLRGSSRRRVVVSEEEDSEDGGGEEESIERFLSPRRVTGAKRAVHRAVLSSEESEEEEESGEWRGNEQSEDGEDSEDGESGKSEKSEEVAREPPWAFNRRGGKEAETSGFIDLTGSDEEDFNARVFDERLPYDLSILWNSKLQRTAGFCTFKRVGSNRSAQIELSSKVIDRPDRLVNTLAHEMCHAAQWLLDGSSKPPHGSAFWKVCWMDGVGGRAN